MKQFDIQIDGSLPKVNQFTQTIGQNFSVLVDYGGWTANKAFMAMELFDQDGAKVTEKMAVLSEKQVLHICRPISKDSALRLRIKSTDQVQTPYDVVQLVAVSPSEKCNEYSYRDNSISPTVTEAKVYGPVEVDLNTPYAPSNRLELKMGQGGTQPELKVSDKDGNGIFEVQAWMDKKVGNNVFHVNGRQIHMNADRLTLNGTPLVLKQVTFSDTTLSVLAAAE